MKKVIIAGAGGFVGSALTKKFAEHGFEVTAVSNRFDERIFPANPQIRKVLADIDEAESLTDAIPADEYEAFYNLAWMGVNGPDKANPYVQLDNIRVALDCAKAAKKLGCKRYLCAGTVAEQAVNSLPHLHFASGGMMYGAAKASARLFLETWCKNQQLDFVWMQFSNIYGPGNRTGNLVSYTVETLSRGETAEFGPAEQPYDFIYIDDLIEAAYRLGVIQTPRSEYYIGSGEPHLLKEFLTEIGSIMGHPELIKIGSRKDDGIRYTWEMFDCHPLTQAIGEYCSHSFQMGIQATVEYERTYEHENKSQ